MRFQNHHLFLVAALLALQLLACQTTPTTELDLQSQSLVTTCAAGGPRLAVCNMISGPGMLSPCINPVAGATYVWHIVHRGGMGFPEIFDTDIVDDGHQVCAPSSPMGVPFEYVVTVSSGLKCSSIRLKDTDVTYFDSSNVDPLCSGPDTKPTDGPVCQGQSVYSENFNNGSAVGWVLPANAHVASASVALSPTVPDPTYYDTTSFAAPYTYEVDVKPADFLLQNRAGFRPWLGTARVVFNMQDQNNYTFVEFGHEYVGGVEATLVTLNKKVAGRFSQVARFSGSYELGRKTATVSVQALLGNRFVVNGTIAGVTTQLFDFSDVSSTATSGKVGFAAATYNQMYPSAEGFDNVKVTSGSCNTCSGPGVAICSLVTGGMMRSLQPCVNPIAGGIATYSWFDVRNQVQLTETSRCLPSVPLSPGSFDFEATVTVAGCSTKIRISDADLSSWDPANPDALCGTTTGTNPFPAPSCTEQSVYTETFNNSSTRPFAVPGWTLGTGSTFSGGKVFANAAVQGLSYYSGSTFSAPYKYQVDLNARSRSDGYGNLISTWFGASRVAFNIVDANHYYFLEIGHSVGSNTYPYSTLVTLNKRDGAVETAIAPAFAGTYEIADQTVTIAVEAKVGNKFTVTATKAGVATVLFADVVDAQYTTGTVGFAENSLNQLTPSPATFDNVSVISGACPTMCLGKSTYVESFNSGSANGWTLVSSARVQAGVVAVSPSPSTTQFGAAAYEGSVYGAATYTAPYTYSVDVQPAPPATGNFAGVSRVIFNYQDQNNYYYLEFGHNSIPGSNSTVFNKRVAGIDQVVAPAYAGTFDARGMTVKVSVDVPSANRFVIKATMAGTTTTLFDVTEAVPSFTSGKVGFLDVSYNPSAPTSAIFDNVKVISGTCYSNPPAITSSNGAYICRNMYSGPMSTNLAAVGNFPPSAYFQWTGGRMLSTTTTPTLPVNAGGTFSVRWVDPVSGFTSDFSAPITITAGICQTYSCPLIPSLTGTVQSAQAPSSPSVSTGTVTAGWVNVDTGPPPAPGKFLIRLRGLLSYDCSAIFASAVGVRSASAAISYSGLTGTPFANGRTVQLSSLSYGSMSTSLFDAPATAVGTLFGSAATTSTNINLSATATSVIANKLGPVQVRAEFTSDSGGINTNVSNMLNVVSQPLVVQYITP
jgi:hypothetical protein